METTNYMFNRNPIKVSDKTIEQPSIDVLKKYTGSMECFIRGRTKIRWRTYESGDWGDGLTV